MTKRCLTLLTGLFFFLLSAKSQVNYNANDFSKVPAYTSPFYYGVNPGSYWNWDDRAKANIAAGNTALNIKGVGSKSFHTPLPENFLETWGYDIRVSEFQHYASLGMKDHTIFLETPSPAHKDNTKYGGCADESLLWKNLYESIWDGGANGTPINENNYYALYVYKTVSRYKNFTKFWEVINEPDMGPKAFEPKGSPGNWWENAPSPCDLSHIKAPIYHYIRMLRITYEVVKTLDPTAYVSPAGIGSGSFLDALLRYTDNPVDGSVTSAYPAKGGAYFDVLSFHFYPMYSLKGWANGSYFYKRHSDAAIQTYLDHKNHLNSVLTARGYDGVTYPKKFMICTENGLPRKAFGDLIGSDDAQKNYVIKSLVESQKNDVRQYYWFILGDGKNDYDATWEFDLMGLYLNLNYNGPISGPGYLQKYSNAGIAFKTTSDLLSNFRYDENQTNLLNLPAHIGGAAFYGNGGYRYVLWAKTTTDKSEAVSATYSFPAAINLQGVKRREWNFTETGATADVSSQNITLTGTPSFFLPGEAGTPPAAPVADAGADVSITLPLATINLDGSKSTAPGGTITKYSWSQVSGPSTAVILSPLAAGSVVNTLLQGTYVFRLTVTNNSGLAATDDVSVTVAPLISSDQVPIANAGKDETLPVGQATVLRGDNSTAPGGTITTYQWTKFSGPANYEMLSPNASATWVRNMVSGVYVFRLTVTGSNGLTAYDDVMITVGNGGTTPTNQPPVARAGNDISITLPLNSVTLTNAGSSDAEGSITAYKWTWISGPSQALPLTPDASSSTVNNLVAGSYVYRLTVTDNGGLTAYDDVTVTVNAATTTNQPIANAGKDETIPVGQATVLHGENSTAPGSTIKSYLWTKYAGPAAYEMLSPSSSATWIRNMVAGVYVFRLTVTDNNGATAYDDVVITVGSGTTLPPVNQLPVAKAGEDVTITLPANTVTLSNAGSYDSDGSITSFAWSYLTGPSQPSLLSPSAAVTQVSNLVAGTYTFRLTVTDNAGGKGYDDITVLVKSSGNTSLPVANAGKDETIPVGQATVLRGETSTAAAGIRSYQWTKYSGPSSYELLSPSSSASWVRSMVAGTYIYRLTITDNNGNTATDDVMITVYPRSGITGNSTPLESIETATSGLQVSVYPNPVSGQLNYKWNSNYVGKAEVVIVNSSGSRLKSVSVNKSGSLHTGTLDVSALRQGIYFLEIKAEDGRFVTTKFIKD